jgi:Zn-dependent protease with chaperone function
LERTKSNGAQAVALTVGLIGTALLAGATFAYIYANMIPLMIVLAVPGFIGWGVSYMLYNKLKAKKSAATEPLIDRKYDEIYEVCAKAYAML